MHPILFFADRLPPLAGGMEVHAGYFIEHFEGHPRYPLLGVVTRDSSQRDCLLQGDRREPVALGDLPARLPSAPSIVFFNSGRWVESLEDIRAAFPRATFVYRTGGNEIVKAPLDGDHLGDHRARQAFWVERLGRCIDLLITNSAFTEERLTSLGLRRELFVRVVGGVHVQALRAARRPHRDPGAPPSLFCAARFVPYKNHALLCQVLATLARRGCRFRLELAGDGPLLEATREDVRRLGIPNEVAFLGLLTNEEVRARIAGADFYIQLSADLVTKVPGGSYVHAEGMGRSILEALSCGTFVIAARSGALPEIVTHERGLLVDLGPPELVADRIEPLLRDPPPRPPFFDGYSWSRCFSRYEELWDAIHARVDRH